MNITFMIGNGFDLNQKLRTGYKDFYAYYRSTNPDDIISRSIEKDYELWADLELGLGLLLKDVSDESIDEFLDSKARLESCLTQYLLQESSRFYITDEAQFADEFRRKILNFFGDFSTVDKNHYHSVMQSTYASVQYQFITFNYTPILGKMIDVTQKKYPKFSNRAIGNTSYTDVLCTPHHLHGILGGQDMILCVDNPSQIANESFQTDARIVDYMVKTNVNKALGEMKTEKAKEIIDKSTYVCLFGLSIGDTDSTWWKYLMEWLKKSKVNRLVIYTRDTSNLQRSGTELIRMRDRSRSSFLLKSNCKNDETLKNVRDQIIIVTNSQIFSFENVRTEDSENGQA